MVYAASGRYPSTHPVAVPTLIVVLLYPPVLKGAVLSSGRHAAHADFMNGWDIDAFHKLVAGLNYSVSTSGLVVRRTHDGGARYSATTD